MPTKRPTLGTTLSPQAVRQAEEAGNNSALGLFEVLEALGRPGTRSAAEAFAAKLNELFPEDTFQQKVLLPVIRSTIQRSAEISRQQWTMLSPVTQYPNVVVFYNRARRLYGRGGSGQGSLPSSRASSTTRDGRSWEIFEPLVATRSGAGLRETRRLRKQPQSLRWFLHLERR